MKVFGKSGLVYIFDTNGFHRQASVVPSENLDLGRDLITIYLDFSAWCKETNWLWDGSRFVKPLKYGLYMGQLCFARMRKQWKTLSLDEKHSKTVFLTENMQKRVS